jgi:hypothetical protein
VREARERISCDPDSLTSPPFSYTSPVMMVRRATFRFGRTRVIALLIAGDRAKPRRENHHQPDVISLITERREEPSRCLRPLFHFQSSQSVCVFDSCSLLPRTTRKLPVRRSYRRRLSLSLSFCCPTTTLLSSCLLPFLCTTNSNAVNTLGRPSLRRAPLPLLLRNPTTTTHLRRRPESRPLSRRP